MSSLQVMDLLGTSLYELHRFCNFKFSLKTTLMLTEQLLARLEWVHGRGVLHNDIKPLNFTMGIGTNVRIAMPRLCLLHVVRPTAWTWG